MALSYKTRRRLSIVILLVALPAYVVAALVLVSAFEGRPHIVIEVLIYAGLGILWIFPLKAVFRGIGQEDPDK